MNPPTPKQPWQGAEQIVRREYEQLERAGEYARLKHEAEDARAERDAAGTGQPGIRRHKLRAGIRHWFRWLTRQPRP